MRMKKKAVPYIKPNGAKGSKRFSPPTSGASVESQVRPSAWTNRSVAKDQSRFSLNLRRAGFRKTTSRPARKKAKAQLPPSPGSLVRLSRRWGIILLQKKLVSVVE